MSLIRLTSDEADIDGAEFDADGVVDGVDGAGVGDRGDQWSVGSLVDITVSATTWAAAGGGGPARQSPAGRPAAHTFPWAARSCKSIFL